MNLLNDFTEKLRKSGFMILLVMFSFYFTINTIKGDRGIIKYMYLKNKVEQAQGKRNHYQEVKKDLEHKVAMLSEKSLDLDYLEERARIVLNMAGTNEYVILDKDINKK